MEKENQLTTRVEKTPISATERGLKLQSLDDMWRFAIACVNSGQFKDITTPENAVIRMQAGMELGLSPIWSLTNIMVVNGKPSVYGDGMLGIVLAKPDCEGVDEVYEGTKGTDNYCAVCTVQRKGRLPVKREFSIADAKRAGLWEKPIWKQYPYRMLQMRARSWACRDSFADALRGLGCVEELRDLEPAKPKAIQAKIVLPDEPETPLIEDAPEQPAQEDRNEDGSFKF